MRDRQLESVCRLFPLRFGLIGRLSGGGLLWLRLVTGRLSTGVSASAKTVMVDLETSANAVGCETDDGFCTDVEEFLFSEAVCCLDYPSRVFSILYSERMMTGYALHGRNARTTVGLGG